MVATAAAAAVADVHAATISILMPNSSRMGPRQNPPPLFFFVVPS